MVGVILGRHEYVETIGFTMYSYLTGKIVTRDLIKGAERSLGEYLEHFVRGKLAELAFKKFLHESSGLDTVVDIDLPYFIPGKYLPDILAFKQGDRWVTARFWIEVKAVTEGQKWMLIASTSVQGSKRTQPRPYCAYVNARVGLTKDHLGRLIKYAPNAAQRMSEEWVARLADLEKIDVEILGFALYGDIANILKAAENPNAREELDKVFGPRSWGFFAKGESLYDPQTGKDSGEVRRDNCAIALSRLRSDWRHLVEQLARNQPLVEIARREQTQLESQMQRALETLSRQKSESWFKRELDIERHDPSLKNFV